jgi:putative ABC transport system ATP-binding protein
VLGYLFQDGGLIERMSVLDNVRLPLRYGGMSAIAAARQALEALERMGIADKAARRVGQLSGGERLRVGLARAVAARPAILICDEPTASLDAENAALITTLLRDTALAGAAVVTASHDPVVIARAGRLISLERGRVLEGELVP